MRSIFRRQLQLHILCAHLGTKNVVADIRINPAESVKNLKTMVEQQLAKGEPSLTCQIKRWLFEAAPDINRHEPILTEITETYNEKMIRFVGLKHHSILYLDMPALPAIKPLPPLWPLWCFQQALESLADAAMIVAIVTRLNCGLEATATKEDEEDVMQRMKKGATPLLIATMYARRSDVATMLVDAGANVKAVYKETGSTPLHFAAKSGAVPLVKLLLSKGAELENKNVDGNTPLALAAAMGHADVIAVLLASGANVETTDQKCRTPLHVSSSSAHVAAVEALLDGGANIEATGEDGRTPLHIASSHDHVAVVKTLLAAGAKPPPIAS